MRETSDYSKFRGSQLRLFVLLRKMKLFYQLVALVGAVNLLKLAGSGSRTQVWMLNGMVGQGEKASVVVQNPEGSGIHSTRNRGACWNVGESACLQDLDLWVSLRKRIGGSGREQTCPL